MCFFLFSYFKQSGPKGKVSLLFQMSMAMNIKKINWLSAVLMLVKDYQSSQSYLLKCDRGWLFLVPFLWFTYSLLLKKDFYIHL